MLDRDTVVRGLHNIAGFIAGRIGIEQARNFLRTIDDAIALLKEQKAVEPDTDSEGTCFCGNCGETVGWFPVGCSTPNKLCKFCPECGQAVKWE